MGSQDARHEMRHHRGSIPVCLSLSLFFGLGLLLVFSSPSQQQPRVAPGTEHQLPTEEEVQADDAVATTLAGWCPYGSLAGYWDTGAAFPDSRWNVMHPTCVLHSLVEPLVSHTAGLHAPAANDTQTTPIDGGAAAPAAQPDTGKEAAAGSSGEAGEGLKLPPLQLPPRLTEVTKELDRLADMAQAALPASINPAIVPSDSGSPAGSSAGGTPSDGAVTAVNKDEAGASIPAATDAELQSALSARILFLSDSVDRFILTYLCNVVEGEAIMMNLDGTPRVEAVPPASPNPPPPPPEAPPAPPPPSPPTPSPAPSPSPVSSPEPLPDSVLTNSTLSTATQQQQLTEEGRQGEHQPQAEGGTGQGQQHHEQLHQSEAEHKHEGVAEEQQADAHAGSDTQQPADPHSAGAATSSGTQSQGVVELQGAAVDSNSVQLPAITTGSYSAGSSSQGNTPAGAEGPLASTATSEAATTTGSGSNHDGGTNSAIMQGHADATVKAAGVSSDAGGVRQADGGPTITQQEPATGSTAAVQPVGSTATGEHGSNTHTQHQALQHQHHHHAHQHHQHHIHHQEQQQQQQQQAQQETAQRQPPEQKQAATNAATAADQQSGHPSQPARKLLLQWPAPQMTQPVLLQQHQGYVDAEDDPQLSHEEQLQLDEQEQQESQQQGTGSVLLSITQSIQGLVASAGRMLHLTGPGQQGPSGTLLYKHNTGIRTAQQVQARSTLPAGAIPTDGGPGSSGLADGEALTWHSQMSSQAYVAAGGRAARMPGPVKRYLPTVCEAPHLPGLKLMSTYIPGVHPTGPYHRGVRRGWQQQVVDAARLWDAWSSTDQSALAGKQDPPYIVVLSSCLWDLARLHAYEPDQVAGSELSPALLEAWAANFTHVVKGVRAALPQASMLVYHSTMMPRFDPHTGVLEKRHLGRRLYISQLNAAGKQVAASLGLEVVDYAALANRFMEGQSYLADDIHPGPGVGLEAANILLNYVHQVRLRQAQNPDWQHPSMWLDRPQHHLHHLLQGNTPPPARSMHTRPKRSPSEPAADADNNNAATISSSLPT